VQSISCLSEGKARKRLHSENPAESFGIWGAEMGARLRGMMAWRAKM